MFWAAYTIQSAGLLLAIWGAAVFVRAVKRRRSMKRPSGVSRAELEARVQAQTHVRTLKAPALIGVTAAVVGCAIWWLGANVTGWAQGGALQFERSQIIFLTAFLLAVVAISSAVIAWRFYPARGGRQCPKCLYECNQIPAPTCPECGYSASTWSPFERDIREPRLLWAAAVLLPLSWLVLKGPTALQHKSWLTFVPTTALIAGWKYLPDDLVSAGAWQRGSRQRATLTARLRNAEQWHTWRWQVQWFLWIARRDVKNATNLEDLETGYEGLSIVGSTFVDTTEETLPLILKCLSREPLGPIGPYTIDALTQVEWQKQLGAKSNPRATKVLAENPALFLRLLDDRTHISNILGNYVGVAAATDVTCRDYLGSEFSSETASTKTFVAAINCAMNLDPTLEGWIRDRITSGNGPRRAAAITVYENLLHLPGVLDAVHEWADDPDPYAAANASLLLLWYPGHETRAQNLTDRMARDPSKIAACIPYFAFARPRDPRLLDPLIKFIADPANDDVLRADACFALRGFGSDAFAALPTLDAAAQETSRYVSGAAKEAAKAVRAKDD